MNFYGIRDLSNNTKSVMSSVSTNKKVIITDNGKPSAIMLSINESNFETILAFVQKLEMQLAVTELQKQSLANFPDSISDDEIQKEIDATRKGN
ncbi:MAG: type II toxin-antitoxin system Phd/YefM family antitoxin [Candidatus Borkfalkiaceae bacterium]|nr:type II toxin-antitoxin system Phd/YefM family antitoxin [Christensenellaceae bacterium]